MDRDVSPTRVVSNAPNCPPAHPMIPLDGQDGAAASLEGPALETCMRELDAVLASLDPMSENPRERGTSSQGAPPLRQRPGSAAQR